MNTLSIILMVALVICLVLMVLGYFGLKKKESQGSPAKTVSAEIKDDLSGFIINVEAGTQAVGSDLSQWFQNKQTTAQAEADAAALLIKSGYTVTAPTPPQLAASVVPVP